MIFYFSATGNCKYTAIRIAERLNDQTQSIPEWLEQGETLYIPGEGEKIGIVTPTYSWRLPEIVERFLNALCLPEGDQSYVYIVSTYGTTPGITAEMAKSILADQKIRLSAAFSVRMPDTWTPVFDLSNPEKVAAQNAKAETEIDAVIARIAAGDTGNHQKMRLPNFVMPMTTPAYERMRKTSHFRLDDSCIGCGLCARKCPAQAIGMREKRPVWVKDQCIMCLGCLHRCPKFAIQYENRTRTHGQYTNPNVKV